MDEKDVVAVAEKFGNCVAPGELLSITKRYDGKKFIGLKVNEQKWVQHYRSNSRLSETSAQRIKDAKSLKSLIASLEQCEEDKDAQQCLSYLREVLKRVSP